VAPLGTSWLFGKKEVDHFLPLLICIMVLDSQVQQVNLGLEKLLTMVFKIK
jgi:hypothetical protein